jgi:chromosome segregation ATPase
MDRRFDGMDKRFDGMDKRFDGMDERFDKIEGEIYISSGRQNDVISKVVEIQKTVNRISETQAEQTLKLSELVNRVDIVDRRLNVLDERTAQTDTEVREIRKMVQALIAPVLDGRTLWDSIAHLEERIARLEEKLSS